MEITIVSPYEIKKNTYGLRNNQLAIVPLSQSIHEFGFTTPIIINKDKEVVCGNLRLEVARQIGLTGIPAIVVDWDQEKCKRYALIDNQVQERSGWNWTKKREIVAEAGIDKGIYGMADEIRDINEIDGLFNEDDTLSLFDIADQSLFPSVEQEGENDEFKQEVNEERS